MILVNYLELEYQYQIIKFQFQVQGNLETNKIRIITPIYKY